MRGEIMNIVRIVVTEPWHGPGDPAPKLAALLGPGKPRAERRAGEMLAVMPKAEGGRPYQSQPATGRKLGTPRLADIGISRDQSSRWQAVAAVPALAAALDVDGVKLAEAGALPTLAEFLANMGKAAALAGGEIKRHAEGGSK